MENEILGQIQIGEKTNEIPDFQQLLCGIDIPDTIFEDVRQLVKLEKPSDIG